MRLELIRPDRLGHRQLPARYSIEYEITFLPETSGTSAEVAYLYPGPRIRDDLGAAGEFTVRGALALRLTYPCGSGLASVVNVYTVEKKVKVYATVVTD